MIRRPPRSTLSSSSAASDVYKRQEQGHAVTKFLSTLVLVLVLVIVGLAALAAVGPALAKLVTALVPLVAVVAIAVTIVRLAWWYTR